MAQRVSVEVFYDYPHLDERNFGGTGRDKWILEANDSQGIEFLEMLRSRQVDVITFTSSSTVTNLLAATGGAEILTGVVIAVIGPVTAITAREAGLPPGIQAPSADMARLAGAIAGYFEKRI